MSCLVPRTLRWLLGSWKIWFESRQVVNALDGGVFDSIANTSAEVSRVSCLTVARSVSHYCVKYWATSVRLTTGVLYMNRSLTWAPQLASWSSVTFAWQTNGFKHPLVSTSFFQPAELQTTLKFPIIKVNEFITWNRLQLCVWKWYIYIVYIYMYIYIYIYIWNRGSTVVKALCYKSESHWFDSRWCHWNISLTQSFRSHHGPLTEMSTRSISWG